MRKLLLLFLLLSFSALADERILEFHSDIVVMEDGWIDVTETIRVRAEGNRIRRGIYRDFPTEYRDRYGNDVVVGFDIISVQRNGAREDRSGRRNRGTDRLTWRTNALKRSRLPRIFSRSRS